MIQCRFFFLNAYKNISAQRPSSVTVSVHVRTYVYLYGIIFIIICHLLFRSEYLHVYVYASLCTVPAHVHV